MTAGVTTRDISLRLSITPVCPFKCAYCQPEGLAGTPSLPVLPARTISRLVWMLSRIGVNRVRLTGGEPLSRPDCAGIISQIRVNREIRDIALTTNGEWLARQAHRLRQAGLDRINIHLDTLRPDRFLKITGRDRLDAVIAGIDTAVQAGLSPVKVNTVLMAGINDDELVDFCNFSVSRNITVRFIELMNTGPAPEFVHSRFVSADHARRIIAREFDLIPCVGEDASGPAREFRIANGAGRIGFIASETEPFCDRCNRIRLTADGRLRGCLYEPDGVDILSLLQEWEQDEAAAEGKLRQIIAGKRSFHPECGEQGTQAFPMSGIGG